MRNLTIKRTKSFVGCLAKMKIYIEDFATGETLINNIPCRKIGELKNGEEKTFQIEEQALKVFVIADNLSKNYCNEVYQLPDGGEDIFLSGKNRFNPANGNAFRFDNNETEAVVQNRKRGTRTGAVVLIVAIIAGVIAGYVFGKNILFKKAPKEKIFSTDGMSITLSDEFEEKEAQNFTVAYDSEKVAVLALKEPFDLADGFGDYTLDQYADLLIETNNLVSAQKKNSGGLNCIEYDYINPTIHKKYHYYSYVYKTDDSFWLLQFATLDTDAEKYSEKIEKWAKSVRFAD